MSSYPVLLPTLQLGFYKRLKESENSYLLPALLTHVGTLDIGQVDNELLSFVGNEKLSVMARQGLRGELIFPIPYILKTKPSLLGYYRLLLGFSQKEFYKKDYLKFKTLEQGLISPGLISQLNPLCNSLAESSWILLNGIPELSQEIIHSLTLISLGPQFRGSRNNNLGIEAIASVFASVRAMVVDYIIEETSTKLVIENPAKRRYQIEFAPDPDIAIRQLLDDGTLRNRISVEVKGGTDYSNIHNRLGEAEKTHQNARASGFTQFWTIVNVDPIEKPIWKQETPTTNELFYLNQIINPRELGYLRFKEYLISELGL